MGLERLASVVQDVDSIFDVDTIKALREEVCHLAGAVSYTHLDVYKRQLPDGKACPYSENTDAD